jgi:hypothetical protein
LAAWESDPPFRCSFCRSRGFVSTSLEYDESLVCPAVAGLGRGRAKSDESR